VGRGRRALLASLVPRHTGIDWHQRSVLFMLMRAAGGAQRVLSGRRPGSILPAAGIGPGRDHSMAVAAGHLLTHLFERPARLARRSWGRSFIPDFGQRGRLFWVSRAPDEAKKIPKSLKGAGLAGRRVLSSPRPDRGPENPYMFSFGFVQSSRATSSSRAVEQVDPRRAVSSVRSVRCHGRPRPGMIVALARRLA